MALNEEKEMNEQKPRKQSTGLHRQLIGRFKRTDDVGQLVDELIAENKKMRENLHKLHDTAAKLRVTIAKSKKLIADWEC